VRRQVKRRVEEREVSEKTGKEDGRGKGGVKTGKEVGRGKGGVKTGKEVDR
jgi:hypothetical protein